MLAKTQTLLLCLSFALSAQAGNPKSSRKAAKLDSVQHVVDSITVAKHLESGFEIPERVSPDRRFQLKSNHYFNITCNECFRRHYGCGKRVAFDTSWICVVDHP